MLIKKARMCMSQKLYSEAAMSYEKYLKILDIVFDVKKGDRLKPEAFKDSARTTELTVVASVYWDLLRIYDTPRKVCRSHVDGGKAIGCFYTVHTHLSGYYSQGRVFSKDSPPSAHRKTVFENVGQRASSLFHCDICF